MLLPLRYSFRLVSKKKLARDRAFRVAVGEVVKNDAVSSSSADDKNGLTVNDKKRNFLKAAGAAGALALVASLIPKKADAYVFGSTPASNVVGLKDTSGTPVTPAKTGQLPAALTDPGGSLKVAISETISQLPVALTTTTNYLKVSILGGAADGVAGANVGIKNISEQRINPALEGGNLLDIKTAAVKLQFDGSSNLKTTSGVQDTASVQINPATEESLVLLRRMVKIMESQASTDASNRQRVNVDGFGTNVALVTGVGASAAGVPRMTVSNDSTLTLLTGSASIGFLDGRQFLDITRNTYANSIRNNLTFS